ncbi:MAG: PSD1 and planctomycete cytochrome C domain-containing protein [Aureliella sp.]
MTQLGRILLTALLWLTWSQDCLLTSEPTVDFEAHIAPILVRRCVECHQSNNASGGLLLTSHAGLLDGGESGSILSIEVPGESYLLERVKSGEMPPPEKGHSRQLPQAEIELLEAWLVAGAQWPDDRKLDWLERTTELRAGRDWWSLQPISKPEPPKLGKLPQPEHPIDAFIFARMEQQGLVPAPQADRPVLLRRLYYDLIGLPPTPTQIADFEQDHSDGAWEKVIDQLLSSPQYGQRWARFWLDLARYADTSGYERDQEKPFAWKYRDWVIKAFNDDMPYSQFVIEQLAGDEIEKPDEQSVIATGFLRLGTWNDEPNDQEDYQYERLEDLVHTTTTAFLGLTVKCARCHTHKFDPIEHEDYYRVASAFWPGPILSRDRAWLGGPSAQEMGFDNVLAWTDITTNPSELHLLKNGDREQPQQRIEPASLSCVPALYRTFKPPTVQEKTTGRRLQLAQWIADPSNPLTWRVAANRIWQHHFGEAIVRTPDNFGFLANPPTHPGLLDWLAADFISHGSLKRMHKLIVTSQTWQQASLHPEQDAYALVDSSNRMWWHAERRRLDAESLRDSMLAITGELDLSLGGACFRPTLAPEALEGLSMKSAAYEASPIEQQNRRSIYGYLQRSLLPPLLTAFDLCDATGPTGQRAVTLVPTQSLALLNNQFVHDRSQNLALSILAEAIEPIEQAQLAWLAIIKRAPSQGELEASIQHIVEQRAAFAAHDNAESPPHERPPEQLALASLCHVLMNSNEFIYID